MRTALLILATIVLCALGFGAYLLFQPASMRTAATESMPRPMNTTFLTQQQANEDGLTVGPGEGPWVRQFDSSGRLANAFRATKYDPQRGGMVKVAEPEMVFFMKDGRRLKLRGHDGDVFVREGGGAGKGKGGAAAAGPMGGGPTRPPSRGRLNDVRIEMFEAPSDADPALTLTMNNVAFDNDTFRIATEPYTDETGRPRAGDEVPVTIRSREDKYEFDGRGLTIRWNDRDDRLEMLEVTHGERLLVNDPALLSKSTSNVQARAKPADAASPTTAPSPADATVTAPLPEATVVPVVAPIAPPPVPATQGGKAHPPQPPYRITFHDDVTIRQGDQTLVRGVELLQVDLVLPRQGGDSDKEKAAPPATQPAPAAPSAVATTQPAETPAAATTPPESTQPATQPATQPSQPPFILYWTGKLRIIPQSPDAPTTEPASPPLAPGQSVVKMFGGDSGQPVVLTRDGGEAYCAAVTYRSADGSVTLHNSPQVGEVVLRKFADDDLAMLRPPLATIHTEGVDYQPARHRATLHGRSRARLPLAIEDAKGNDAAATALVRPNGPKDDEVFYVTWATMGNLYLSGEGSAAALDRLELAGDVDVDHPQIKLRSQKLEMAFDHEAKLASTEAPEVNPTTQPTKLASGPSSLRHVRAAEAVACRIIDADGSTRSLWCDLLDLDTARTAATAADRAGRPYPHQIDARGHVRALDGEQQLIAGLLQMTLAPAARGATTRPSDLDTNTLELQRLVAKEAVRVNSPDGAAAADELYVTRRGANEHHVELVGEPFAEAVDKKGSVLRGPRLTIDPRTGRAQVAGVGSLHAIQEGADGAPGRPMDVAWTGGADVDGPRNRIDVNGGVRVVTPDADGTVTTATAERVHITLAPKPTTQPAGAAGVPTDMVPVAANVGGGAPIAAAQPATRPSRKGGTPALATMPTDVFKDKQVSSILLEEKAVVDSQLLASDGQSVLRETRLRGPQIIYDVLKDHLTVPAAGDLVVRDHTPLPPQQQQQQPPQRQGGADRGVVAANDGPDNGLGTFRGAAVFRWRDRMDYDQGRRRAVMAGNVEVAYRGDDVRELPVQLVADRVLADFVPKPVPNATAAKPATRPAGQGGLLAGVGGGGEGGANKLDLKLMTAYGNVHVNRGGQELAADRLNFDPATGVISAFGGGRGARFTEAGGSQYTEADQIEWNTKTWHVRAQNIRARSR